MSKPVGEPVPVPVDDIERLLRSYDSVNGYRLDARLLVRRVQRWLESLPKPGSSQQSESESGSICI